MPRNFFDDQSQELRSPFVSEELFATDSESEQQMFQPDATFESPFLDVVQREDGSHGADGYEGSAEPANENIVSLDSANESGFEMYAPAEIDTEGAMEEHQVPTGKAETIGATNTMCGHQGFYGVLGRRRPIYSLTTPHRWVCHLFIRGRFGFAKELTEFYGTGILISPRHVLTAAHLVKIEKHNGQVWTRYEIDSIRVSPGRNHDALLDAYQGKVVGVAQGFNPRKPTPEDDYAVIELDKAIGEETFKALGNQKLLHWGSAAGGGAIRTLSDQTLVDEAAFVTGFSGKRDDARMYQSQGRITNVRSGTVFTVTAQVVPSQAGSAVWVTVNGKHCLAGIMAGPTTAVRITPAVCTTLQGWLKAAVCTGANAPQKEFADEAGYGYERREVVESFESNEASSGCSCGCKNKSQREGSLFDPTQLETEALDTESYWSEDQQYSDYNDLESSAFESDASESENIVIVKEAESGDDMGLGEEPWTSGEMEEQVAPASHIKARILWPALGFPAVIAPSAQPARDADPTKCITLLILTDNPQLKNTDVAAFLRIVPWSERSRRHILPTDKERTFEASEIAVVKPKVTWEPTNLSQASLFEFGGARNTITASLADRVEEIYRNAKMPHRFEIRISEQASARFKDGLYHLFWNNQRPVEDAPSDEVALLLREFATPVRKKLGKLWETHWEYLLDEYEFEYGAIHEPWCRTNTPRRRAEILHPVFVNRKLPSAIGIGHLTDLHVNGRADVYEKNLKTMVDRLNADKARRTLSKEETQLLDTMRHYNNWTKSVTTLYNDAKQDSHILLLTGDLVDYGCEHWGQDASMHLKDHDLYHQDRPWFYFQWLLSRDDAYSRPVYTCLGNHDWRLNPYPPFAVVGAPSPGNYFYPLEHSKGPEEAKDLRKKQLQIAHGDGHDIMLSYWDAQEMDFVSRLKRAKTLAGALAGLVANKSTMDIEQTPADTTVKSIEWYLLAINPFLDYSVALPSGHQLLMLDWAEKEDVLFPINHEGKKFAYMVWQASTASDPGPKAKRCLTTLQQLMIKNLSKTPGKAKIIGVHAPPIGPWSDWTDKDLLSGRKIYGRSKIGKSRGLNYGDKKTDGTTDVWYGHPLFATTPKNKASGMTADYGSFQEGRDWFIEHAAGDTGIRLVFSGHIHRRGLYVVHKVGADRGKTLENERLVYGVAPNAVSGAKYPTASTTAQGVRGPLYVNSTSAGPNGNYNPDEEESQKIYPGYTHAELAVDGTIQCVQFRSLGENATARQNASCVVRKVS